MCVCVGFAFRIMFSAALWRSKWQMARVGRVVVTAKKKLVMAKCKKKLANSHFELKVMESWRFGSDDVPFHLRGDLFYVPC